MAKIVVTRKKCGKAEPTDSFVYRGVRIARTWTTSKRSKEIGEAMQKVMQRGPAEAPVS